MLGVLECLQCQLSTIFWARENWRQWPPSSHRKLTCDWLRFSGFNSSSISEMIGGFLGLPRLSSRMLSSLSDSSLWSSWWLLSEGKYSISSILVGSGSCNADREMSSFFLGNRKIKFYWNNTIYLIYLNYLFSSCFLRFRVLPVLDIQGWRWGWWWWSCWWWWKPCWGSRW